MKKLSFTPRILLSCFAGAVLAGLVGCKNNEYTPCGYFISETETSVVCANGFGEAIPIKKNPQRTIVLQNSLLDLWYLSGGKAIARVSGKENVPAAAEKLTIVGGRAAPGVEKIVSLSPDLIIMSATGTTRKMSTIFNQNNIQSFAVEYNNYPEFLDLLSVFAKINGTENQFIRIAENISNSVRRIIDKCPDKGNPRTLVFFLTTKSVQCQTDYALTANMVRMLKGINVIKPESGYRTYVSYSLEKIADLNPELVLVAAMGDPGKCRQRLEKDVLSSPVWRAVHAGKNNRIHFLPNELFLFKPNGRFPEAFLYLASLMYPDSFNSENKSGNYNTPAEEKVKNHVSED